ncbi:unnamed protein product, partial [Rotaria socialis]
HTNDKDDDDEDDEEEPIILHEKNDTKNENVQEEVLSQKIIELSTGGQKRPVTTPTSSQEENS